MEALSEGYRGVRLLVRMNGDALFTLGTVVVGLLAGAFLGSTLVGLQGAGGGIGF
jgi:hypothetical protein